MALKITRTIIPISEEEQYQRRERIKAAILMWLLTLAPSPDTIEKDSIREEDRK